MDAQVIPIQKEKRYIWEISIPLPKGKTNKISVSFNNGMHKRPKPPMAKLKKCSLFGPIFLAIGINAKAIEKQISQETSINFDDCRILIINRDLTHFDDCINLFTKIHESNIPVLVMAKSFQSEALMSLYENNRIGKIRVACVEIPTSFYEEDKLENLSIVTSSTVFDGSSGVKVRDAKIEDLGFTPSSLIYCRVKVKCFSMRKDFSYFS